MLKEINRAEAWGEDGVVVKQSRDFISYKKGDYAVRLYFEPNFITHILRIDIDSMTNWFPPHHNEPMATEQKITILQTIEEALTLWKTKYEIVNRVPTKNETAATQKRAATYFDYNDLVVHALDDYVIKTFKDDIGVHAETAIAALASLAGLSLRLEVFKVNNLTLDAQEQFKFKRFLQERRMQLINHLLELAKKYFQLTFSADYFKSIFVPEKHKPKEDYFILANRLQKSAWEILEKKQADVNVASGYFGLAAFRMIRITQKVLEPKIGINILVDALNIVSNCEAFDSKQGWQA